ncbi:unnamed protein product, partial [Brachionus calyciflorus]
MEVLFDDNFVINDDQVNFVELSNNPDLVIEKTVYIPYHTYYALPGEHPFGSCGCSQVIVLEEQ